MTQTIMIHPNSKEASWLFNLRVNQQKNRIRVCFNKIERLFKNSRHGDMLSVLELYAWYRDIRTVEGYFDKEIARLSKLIKRKVKEKIYYSHHQSKQYHLNISTPISSSFYRILSKFDLLMCLSESCMTLSIFKKRRLFSRKTNQYKCSIMRVITRISQYTQKDKSVPTLLSQDEKDLLTAAIHADVMPIFTKKTFQQLISLIKEG